MCYKTAGFTTCCLSLWCRRCLWRVSLSRSRCDKIYSRGHFGSKGARNLLFFTVISSLGKRGGRNFRGPGLVGHPVFFKKYNRFEFPFVLGTRVFEQEPSNRKKREKKAPTSMRPTETVSLMWKQIESVNHLCILLAVTKYMYRKRPSSKHRRATSRRKTLTAREKRRGHVHPRPHEQPPR